MKVHIEDLFEQQPYHGTSKAGRPYTINSWVCSGQIDGEPASGFTVKCMGDKPKADIVKGATLDMEKEDFNGKTSYKYKPAFAPSGGGGYGGSAKAQYTKDEYEALFKHAAMFIKTVVAPALDVSDFETMVPMISTYIIGAQNSGIKVN